MNIVVCVKYVPDAQSDRTFNESDNTTDRVGVDGLLSELDEYAVEEALKIVEAGEGEEGDDDAAEGADVEHRPLGMDRPHERADPPRLRRATQQGISDALDRSREPPSGRVNASAWDRGCGSKPSRS